MKKSNDEVNPIGIGKVDIDVLFSNFSSPNPDDSYTCWRLLYM